LQNLGINIYGYNRGKADFIKTEDVEVVLKRNLAEKLNCELIWIIAVPLHLKPAQIYHNKKTGPFA